MAVWKPSRVTLITVWGESRMHCTMIVDRSIVFILKVYLKYENQKEKNNKINYLNWADRNIECSRSTQAIVIRSRLSCCPFPT